MKEIILKKLKTFGQHLNQNTGLYQTIFTFIGIPLAIIIMYKTIQSNEELSIREIVSINKNILSEVDQNTIELEKELSQFLHLDSLIDSLQYSIEMLEIFRYWKDTSEYNSRDSIVSNLLFNSKLAENYAKSNFSDFFHSAFSKKDLINVFGEQAAKLHFLYSAINTLSYPNYNLLDLQVLKARKDVMIALTHTKSQYPSGVKFDTIRTNQFFYTKQTYTIEPDSSYFEYSRSNDPDFDISLIYTAPKSILYRTVKVDEIDKQLLLDTRNQLSAIELEIDDCIRTREKLIQIAVELLSNE